jgi:hypothetical protein
MIALVDNKLRLWPKAIVPGFEQLHIKKMSPTHFISEIIGSLM